MTNAIEKAIGQKLTLRQVQKLVKETKVSELPDQLETEISDLAKQFRRSKASLSPQKRSEIEGLLKRLKLLLYEEN